MDEEITAGHHLADVGSVGEELDLACQAQLIDPPAQPQRIRRLEIGPTDQQEPGAGSASEHGRCYLDELLLTLSRLESADEADDVVGAMTPEAPERQHTAAVTVDVHLRDAVVHHADAVV